MTDAPTNVAPDPGLVDAPVAVVEAPQAPVTPPVATPVAETSLAPVVDVPGVSVPVELTLGQRLEAKVVAAEADIKEFKDALEALPAHLLSVVESDVEKVKNLFEKL